MGQYGFDYFHLLLANSTDLPNFIIFLHFAVLRFTFENCQNIIDFHAKLSGSKLLLKYGVIHYLLHNNTKQV
jgi:hypothetical protein